MRALPLAPVLVGGALVLGAASLFLGMAGPADDPPTGPFGLSMLATQDGEKAEIEDFFLSSDCALCHPRQWKELSGSMHSVAHEDGLYRAFAELGRKEAGEEVYTYCSGCHSAAGVVSGLIPSVPEHELSAEAKAGVTCDVCHTITELTGHSGPWGEPGNASFVLDPGRVKFGPLPEIERNPAHTGEKRDFYSTSEYCASCHTIIHPINGLRIEHTYEEWKHSPYAEAGIQCQDCHMRSVEDSIRVAREMKPVSVRGTSARKGEEREIHPHYFVGGNTNAHVLGGDHAHSEMAEARLKSAAELEVEAPGEATPGAELAFELLVHNVGAGHSLPTSLTELREMWLHVRVLDAGGALLFESGALDDHGEITEGAARFGAHTVDASGALTYKPWEAVDFAWKRLVPPKGTARDTFGFDLPAEVVGPVTIEARLLYRSAPPHVVHEIMGADAFEPDIVEMATSSVSVEVR